MDGFFDRVAEDPSAYARECDRIQAVLGCQLKTALIAGCEFLGIASVTASVDGTHCVYNVLGRQIAAVGYLGIARVAVSDTRAVRGEIRPRSAVDSAADSPARSKLDVGGVDYRIHMDLRYVVDYDPRLLHDS